MKGLMLITTSITKLNKLMVWVAGILVTFMSAIIFYDVLARYFFKSPTGWSLEVGATLTGAIGLILGGYALAKDYHVRVDLFYEKFSLRTKRIMDIISGILLLLIAISLIWMGFKYVLHYMNVGAKSSSVLRFPLWIYWLIIPVGGVLIGLQGIVKLISDIYTLATGKILHSEKED